MKYTFVYNIFDVININIFIYIFDQILGTLELYFLRDGGSIRKVAI